MFMLVLTFVFTLDFATKTSRINSVMTHIIQSYLLCHCLQIHSSIGKRQCEEEYNIVCSQHNENQMNQKCFKESV